MFGITTPFPSKDASYFYMNKKFAMLSIPLMNKIFKCQDSIIEYSEHLQIDYFLVKI